MLTYVFHKMAPKVTAACHARKQDLIKLHLHQNIILCIVMTMNLKAKTNKISGSLSKYSTPIIAVKG